MCKRMVVAHLKKNLIIREFLEKAQKNAGISPAFQVLCVGYMNQVTIHAMNKTTNGRIKTFESTPPAESFSFLQSEFCFVRKPTTSAIPIACGILIPGRCNVGTKNHFQIILNTQPFRTAARAVTPKINTITPRTTDTATDNCFITPSLV